MEEKRVLITFDKDFGELAFKQGIPASCGIILFRIPLLSPEYAVEFIARVIKSRDDWRGHFSVVETNRIRMRPIR
jgi:predicted nuclease of predicted toxin-antitoxin system